MKTFKYKNRLYRWVYIKIIKLFNSERRARYPKKVSDLEKVVSDIFIKVLHNPESQLYYNISTGECSIKLESQKLFIFLENGKVRVINSTFGYDRAICPELQQYLMERFRHENAKRRRIMKEQALSKIDNSLSITLEKLKKLK